MKTLNKGQDKIQQICDVIRKDTLEPAQKESDEIIAEANKQSDKIVSDAKAEAQRLIEEAKKSIEQDEKVFQSALSQASKQSLEELKQIIQMEMFDEELYDTISSEMKDPKIISSLISAIINALEKDGIDSDISAVISKTAAPDEVNSLLGEKILKKLKETGVTVGDFVGGAMVRLHGKKIVLDMSSDALKDMLATHLRKDFRKILFKS